MAVITVKGKPWNYEATSYYEEARLLNHKDAEYVMLTAKELLDKNNIKFMPMFGTLLGMVREGYFIAHDIDMDLMIYEKDRQALIDLIPDFHEQGIEFSRCSEPWVYSFRYKSADCDFYIINKASWPYNYRYCRVCKEYMPKKYFQSTEKMSFLNNIFDVPENPVKVLEFCYGKDWRTPIKGKAGRTQSKLFVHILLWNFICRAASYVKRHFLDKIFK